jgi:hypothetical protein
MAAPLQLHPLLQKPLYIYTLPPEILSTIALKGNQTLTTTVHVSPHTDVTEPKTDEDRTTQGGIGCAACNIAAFTDVTDQRDHVRSDLHRFNLKRNLISEPVVTADEFDKMLDGICLFSLR